LTAFFYCGDVHSEQQASGIISSFIKQICQYLSSNTLPIPQHVLQKIKRFFRPEQETPDFEDLEDIFIQLLPYVPNTIYILDGLDLIEPEQTKSLLKCIRSAFCNDGKPYTSQILLVSREKLLGYVDIILSIPGIQPISTSSNVMGDIGLYIKESIADKMMLRKLTDDTDLVEKMERTLLIKSRDMYAQYFICSLIFLADHHRFLWVYLQIEIIWDTCFSDIEIQDSLHSLPKSLEETYRRCVRRINVYDRRTIKVLKWVSFANRPLHIDELREAVAFDLEDTKWHGERLPRGNFILGSCANLVTMDLTDYSITFAHFSVKQYLEKYWELIPGYPQNQVQGSLQCGEFCIVYLSFSDFSLQLDRPKNVAAQVKIPDPISLAHEAITFGFTRRLLGFTEPQIRSTSLPFHTIRTASKPDWTKHRFLDYAVKNWALQTRDLSEQSPVWRRFQRLATCYNETWNFHPWVPSGRSLHSHLHGLFGWAVKECHEPLLSIALGFDRELQRVCNIPMTDEGLPALHIASKLGHITIVRILLGTCQVNLQDIEGYTALHHAARRGHYAIVQLFLMAKGIKLDTPSHSGFTPLWLAASNGHDSIVQLLLDSKANIETRACRSRTPLSQAAVNGHYAAARVLILGGANIHPQDEDGRAPLSLALRGRNDSIIDLLLAHSVSTTYLDYIECNLLLIWASNKGYESIVRRLFMTHKLNIEATYQGRTPLSWAAGNGNEAVVKLLIDRGAAVGSYDRNGLTPLMWAHENGHEAIVGLINKRRVQALETPMRSLGSNPIGRSGKMMMCVLASEWNAFFFDLRGTRLVRYETSECLTALGCLDVRNYYVSCGVTIETGQIILGPSERYIDTLYSFRLTTRPRMVSSHENAGKGTISFAVKTSTECLDWISQIMLAKALSIDN
jgi:ankyrin repeat protein